MKIILFVDALDPDDVEDYCPEMAEDMKDSYDVGVPRVTPNVVSQAMTGLPPEDMELLRSTPMFEPSEEDGQRWVHKDDQPVEAEEGPERTLEGDPVQGARRVGIHPYDNILEDLDEEGVTLFQFGTPFCSFVNLENGLSVYDEMNNDQLPAFMLFAEPELSFMDDDWELIHDSYVSDSLLELESVKQLARQDTVDVMFLGYKHIDHCTHWHFPDCKESLIQVLWAYIQDLREMGNEVMWWSDHGSQRKQETFRINKWLKEHGYLNYNVDQDFQQKLQEKGMMGELPLEEQFTLDNPWVDVDWDKTVAFSTDSFDSMVDVTEDASEEEIENLKRELEGHPAIANVWRKAELFDEVGDRFHAMPELIVERGENVLVTGNIHPDASTYRARGEDEDWEEFPEDNMGMRPGVHSPRGCVGGDIPDDTVIDEGKPFQLRDVMWRFVDPEEILEDREESGGEEVKERLQELGYI